MVSASKVLAGVPAFTVSGTTKFNAAAPGDRLGPVHVILLPTCAPQFQAGGIVITPTTTLEGIVSTSVMTPESDGPRFLTVWPRVYVPPAATGSAPLLSVFVTTRFAPVMTVVLAVAPLFALF